VTAADGTATVAIPAGTFTAVAFAHVTVFSSSSQPYLATVISATTTAVNVRIQQMTTPNVLLGAVLYTPASGANFRVAVMGTKS